MKRLTASMDRALVALLFRRTVALQVLGVVLALAVMPLAIIPLAMQERLIDQAIPAKDVVLALLLAALYGGALLGRSVLKSTITYLQGVIAEIVARVLRQRLIDVQRRRGHDEARKELGTATSIIAAEVDALGGFAAEAFSTPVMQGAVMVGVFGFMLTAEPTLAAIGIAALVLEAVITPLMQWRVNNQTRRRIKSLRRISSETIEATETGDRRHVVESLHGVRATFKINLRMNFLKVVMKLAKNTIDHLADIAVLGLGAWLVIKGQTQIGVVVAFLSGLREVREPWGELIGYYRRYEDARTKLDLLNTAMKA